MRTFWTEAEKDVLRQEYAMTSYRDIQKKLNNRTQIAINIEASKLGLVKIRKLVSRMKGELSVLLGDSNETYYWLGFLVADGHFQERGLLSVTLAAKDLHHLEKLAAFLKITNIKTRRSSAVSIGALDKYIINLVCKKLGIDHNKTKHPMSIEALQAMTDDHFYSFLIGFLDGDGCIGFQTGRADVNIRISCYGTWMPVLQYFGQRLNQRLGIHSPLAKLNKRGFASVQWTNNTIARFLKHEIFTLNLPALSRKWDKVSYVSFCDF